MSAYNLFNFPSACRVDQRIAKALFADNGPLTPADRRTFRNEISEIICSYILDENHGIMLTPYSDEEHDYTCLAQVDVFLKKPGKAVRVAELCHRAMPYPLIVVLHHNETTEYTELHRTGEDKKLNHQCPSVPFRGSKIMLSMAEKRFSRDGREQVVLERVVNTDWMPESQLADFRKAADFSSSRELGFRNLYLHYMDLLDVQRCAAITGVFREEGLSPEERRRLLEDLHQLELNLAEIKAAAGKETELSRQIELNIQAKRIENEICEIHRKI